MTIDLKLVSKEINEILWRTHKTIATAESCTSGHLASNITAVPGASAYFKGGLVAYAEETKTKMLGVSAELMAEKTAVCEEVVKQMVIGACQFFDTDYAVASTGFAGPSGPDPKTGIRVGTIWVAAGNAERLNTLLLTEDEGREHNVQKATAAALHLLAEILRDDIPQTEEAEAEEI